MRCVGQWMASNRLKVNPVPRLRPTGNGAFIISVIIDNYYHYQYQHQLNRNSGTTVQPSSTVRDLGVILDSEMSFSLLYINQLVSLCFYQLRCIKACVKALPTAVNSFVVSRIDYCNCLLAGAPQYQLNKLQAMMNSSGRLICGLNKIDHISPVMCCVIGFIGCLLKRGYNTNSVCWSARLSVVLHFCQSVSAVSGRSRLRSSTRSDVVIVQTETDFGGRSFAVSAMYEEYLHRHSRKENPRLQKAQIKHRGLQQKYWI